MTEPDGKSGQDDQGPIAENVNPAPGLYDPQGSIFPQEKLITEDIQPEEVPPPFGGAKKTQRRYEQDMQAWITLGAGGLVVLVVLATLVRWVVDPTVDVTAVAGAILSPLLGVVGTIVGYFFGRRR